MFVLRLIEVVRLLQCETQIALEVQSQISNRRQRSVLVGRGVERFVETRVQRNDNVRFQHDVRRQRCCRERARYALC